MLKGTTRLRTRVLLAKRLFTYVITFPRVLPKEMIENVFATDINIVYKSIYETFTLVTVFACVQFKRSIVSCSTSVILRSVIVFQSSDCSGGRIRQFVDKRTRSRVLPNFDAYCSRIFASNKSGGKKQFYSNSHFILYTRVYLR